jgi:acyl-CoA reductase-like NAD-dependent aldehyde dehydrogenase
LQLNGGQTCIAPRRLFATKRNIERLIPLLRQALASSPARAIQPQGLSVAQQAVAQALEHGAEIVSGHMQAFAQAAQVTPLVLDKVSADMRIATDDIFAPVLSLIEVDDLNTALSLAEQCRYALGASVFGTTQSAKEFADHVRAGCVSINDVVVPTADPRVSFGGWRNSGYGVTRGLQGLREMAQLKVTCERRGRWLPHLTTDAVQLEPMMRAILLLRHGGTLRARWSGLKLLLKTARAKKSVINEQVGRTADDNRASQRPAGEPERKIE